MKKLIVFTALLLTLSCTDDREYTLFDQEIIEGVISAKSKGAGGGRGVLMPNRLWVQTPKTQL